jgi:hypothetical protein
VRKVKEGGREEGRKEGRRKEKRRRVISFVMPCKRSVALNFERIFSARLDVHSTVIQKYSEKW